MARRAIAVTGDLVLRGPWMVRTYESINSKESMHLERRLSSRPVVPVEDERFDRGQNAEESGEAEEDVARSGKGWIIPKKPQPEKKINPDDPTLDRRTRSGRLSVVESRASVSASELDNEEHNEAERTLDDTHEDSEGRITRSFSASKGVPAKATLGGSRASSVSSAAGVRRSRPGSRADSEMGELDSSRRPNKCQKVMPVIPEEPLVEDEDEKPRAPKAKAKPPKGKKPKQGRK